MRPGRSTGWENAHTRRRDQWMRGPQRGGSSLSLRFKRDTRVTRASSRHPRRLDRKGHELRIRPRDQFRAWKTDERRRRSRDRPSLLVIFFHVYSRLGTPPPLALTSQARVKLTLPRMRAIPVHHREIRRTFPHFRVLYQVSHRTHQLTHTHTHIYIHTYMPRVSKPTL